VSGPRVALGCSRLGSTLSGVSGEEAVRLIHHALDAGVTAFDTADIYGQGESERLLGRALRGRAGATVVTKAGQRFTAIQRAATLVKGPLRRLAAAVPALRRGLAGQRAAPLPRDYSPAHLRAAVEAGLRRLGRERIDLFLLHSPDAATIARGEAAGALEDLRRAGKLAAWGVSCDDEGAARAALRLPGLAGLQIPLAVAAPLRAELAGLAARGATVHLRELFADRPRTAESRRAAVAEALSHPGAAALVGTTAPAHLDEAIDAARAAA